MKFQSHSFYNRFSIFYPVVDFFLKPQKNTLLNEINLMPNGNLLDIGVGTGVHLHLYRKHHVTGIDTSSGMLKIASKQAPNHVQLLVMNGEEMAFQDNQFDYVVLSHVIAVVDNPDKLLKEIFRVLKPNGKLFILNHFTPTNWLKYVDRAFGTVAQLLHFKSVFHINDIITISQFTLLDEVRLGPVSYFKLLIYRKKCESLTTPS